MHYVIRMHSRLMLVLVLRLMDSFHRDLSSQAQAMERHSVPTTATVTPRRPWQSFYRISLSYAAPSVALFALTAALQLLRSIVQTLILTYNTGFNRELGVQGVN